MENEKKMAAIMAAVGLYIQAEEEAALQPAPSSAEPPAAQANIWGIVGRQSMMHYRNLMQLKTFHGSQLR
ncbi:MAG: hypothetical protein K9L59_15170 [Desulfobacterales bacterium]|nr:hypothetical protein [Desulfobacterales bacterium]